MLMLEREDRARARGATIYASIDGYGSTCDAYHRVQMAPDGVEIVRAMTLAIERSGRAARGDRLRELSRHVDVLNDAVESRCVRAVFGAHAERLAGLVDQVDDRTSARRQRGRGHRDLGARLPAAFLPPTINQFEPDPAATSTSSRTPAARRSIEAALCNCLGFGSKNSAIVIGAAHRIANWQSIANRLSREHVWPLPIRVERSFQTRD